MNYTDLRNIEKKEKETSALVPLSEDFYQSISQFLELKKSEAISSKSLIVIKEYENVRKIVHAIQSKREEKLVLLSVRGEPLLEGLTKEEQEFLSSLCILVNNCRSRIKITWENDSPPADSLKVRMTADIEKYTGADNSAYGPFKNGETQVLPKSEAHWLIKSKLADLIS